IIASVTDATSGTGKSNESISSGCISRSVSGSSRNQWTSRITPESLVGRKPLTMANMEIPFCLDRHHRVGRHKTAHDYLCIHELARADIDVVGRAQDVPLPVDEVLGDVDFK